MWEIRPARTFPHQKLGRIIVANERAQIDTIEISIGCKDLRIDEMS
jgi:hypothetical protein